VQQRSPGRSLFEPPVRLRCPPALRFSAFPHPGAPLSLSRSSQDLHFAGLRASSSPYPHPGAPLSLSRSSQDLHFAGLRASLSPYPHPGAPLSLSRSSQDLHFAGLRASSSPYHSARVAATRVLVGLVCLTPTGAFSGMLSATSAVLCDESRWRWDWYCDDQRLTLRRSVGPHLLALPLSPAPNPPQPASH
jgi:hypothetical protein